MTERCIHCKEEVALPLRGLGDVPVCGLCAAQRIWTVLLVLLHSTKEKPNDP